MPARQCRMRNATQGPDAAVPCVALGAVASLWVPSVDHRRE
jgi:hypothetical protein